MARASIFLIFFADGFFLPLPRVLFPLIFPDDFFSVALYIDEKVFRAHWCMCRRLHVERISLAALGNGKY